MKTRNEVIIAGHLGRDPERKGNGPFKFSVATGGGKKKDGSGNYPTTWHNVAAWTNQIPEAEGLRKGEQVEVHGRLTYPEWSAPDGSKRKSCEIVASSITVDPQQQSPLTPKYMTPPLPPHEQKIAEARPVTADDPITDSDIPF